LGVDVYTYGKYDRTDGYCRVDGTECDIYGVGFDMPDTDNDDDGSYFRVNLGGGTNDVLLDGCKGDPNGIGAFLITSTQVQKSKSSLIGCNGTGTEDPNKYSHEYDSSSWGINDVYTKVVQPN